MDVTDEVVDVQTTDDGQKVEPEPVISLTQKKFDETIGKRLEQERKKYEKQFKAFEDQTKQLQDELKKVTNKTTESLSAEQLLQERTQEWQRREQEYQTKIDEARNKVQEFSSRAKKEIIQNKLNVLLDSPIDVEDAKVVALHKFGTNLTVNDSGDLQYTDSAGIEYTGKEAEKQITDWWTKKTTLRKAPPPGPGAKGAVTSPQHKDEYKIGDPTLSLDERIALAAKADRLNKSKKKR